jgi:hypothetical protein
MQKRIVSGITLAILVLCLSILAFNIQLVTADEPNPDLNADGKVDLADLIIAGGAFGSREGHPRWNPIADLNEDGKVNMIDLGIIAKNFGSIL